MILPKRRRDMMKLCSPLLSPESEDVLLSLLESHDEADAENERLQKENANHRRKWHKWQHLLATGSLASIIERADEAEARAAKLAVALEEAAEEEERESWNCVQSSDAFVREKTFAEWQAVHPSDIRETLKG